MDEPEKSDEVILAELGEVLRAAGGDYVVALKTLLEKSQRHVEQVTRSTVASRQAEYSRMLEEADLDQMADIEEMMSGLMKRILWNDLSLSTTPDGRVTAVMSTEKAVEVMDEHLDCRKVTEVLKAREKLRRAAIFEDMNERLGAEGVEDPANTNATLEVPERGMKFCREGCGHHDPSLDEGRLRVLLGEEIWTQVCEEVTVSYTETRLNLAKLYDLALDDVTILTRIQDCAVPGAPKTPRLTVRGIT